MRLPSLKLLAVAVLAVGTVGLVANQVIASVPTVKGKGKVFEVVNFTQLPTAQNLLNNVIEVPLKHTMVVTDIIACNGSAAVGEFRLSCNLSGNDSVIMHPVIVPIDSTFQHSFGQGIECAEGTILRYVLLQEGGASVTGWRITITGYLRKGT
jgi:hypothetical protein